MDVTWGVWKNDAENRDWGSRPSSEIKARVLDIGEIRGIVLAVIAGPARLGADWLFSSPGRSVVKKRAWRKSGHRLGESHERSELKS